MLLVCVAVPAFAQDNPGQWQAYLQSNCDKEIKRHCKGVPVGQGRVLACLYAFGSKLSAKCEDAVLASSERLSVATTALANVKKMCEPDAKRLCNGVAMGSGNLVGCLTRAKGSVSGQCNDTLDAAFLRP
jgi:hypothetical protein